MRCSRALSGAFLGLLNNRILKSRLASVGMLSPLKLANYSISGVTGRSGGLRKDLRLKRGTWYGAYWYLTFRSFMGRRGDNLDRFLIRIKETLESFRIVSQVLSTLLLFTEKGHTADVKALPATVNNTHTAASGFASGALCSGSLATPPTAALSTPTQ